MRWEIDEDGSRRGQDEDNSATQWTTRLSLNLPKLGEINAQIRLQGNQIALSMSSDNDETRTLLRASTVALRSQLNEAGLTLASMGIDAGTKAKVDEQAEQ